MFLFLNGMDEFQKHVALRRPYMKWMMARKNLCQSPLQVPQHWSQCLGQRRTALPPTRCPRSSETKFGMDCPVAAANGYFEFKCAIAPGCRGGIGEGARRQDSHIKNQKLFENWVSNASTPQSGASVNQFQEHEKQQADLKAKEAM